MNKEKYKSILTVFLCLFVCFIIVLSSGCSSFVKAIGREFMDDGKHAKIENQSFSSHFKDAFLEDLSGIQATVDKTKR